MLATQAEHDARHPGKICGKCPIEVEHRQLLLEDRTNPFFRGLLFALLLQAALGGLLYVLVIR
jgi:hypothetical protein